MPLDIVIGTQWGDEGKGRIVDLLAAQADVVARFNGGDNAGHTVTVGSRTFKLHLIPSGIIHPHTMGVMGNGMVINPVTFVNEVEMLQSAGVAVSPQRLRISYAAHLITPAHRALDAAQEAARGQAQIGTTGRGIGPAYTGKTSRNGLRMEDMLDSASFFKKMKHHVEEINTMLRAMYRTDPLDENAVAADVALELHRLTGKDEYYDAAASTLEAIAPLYRAYRHHAAPYALAVHRFVNPPLHLIIVGEPTAELCSKLRRVALGIYDPNSLVETVDPAAAPSRLEQLGLSATPAPALYVRRGRQTSGPIQDPSQVRAAVEAVPA